MKSVQPRRKQYPIANGLRTKLNPRRVARRSLDRKFMSWPFMFYSILAPEKEDVGSNAT